MSPSATLSASRTALAAVGASPCGPAPDDAVPQLTAFAGHRRVAHGAQPAVLAQLRALAHAPQGLEELEEQGGALLVFNDQTGALVDLDVRPEGSLPAVPAAAVAVAAAAAPRSVGRPKLGVVAREVTLLQRHWDWLNKQPGGASVALRKLVEEARRIHQGQDAVREAREATYRCMSAIASSLEGFEEAARALFAGDEARFAPLVAAWPDDVATYLQALAAASWSSDAPN